MQKKGFTFIEVIIIFTIVFIMTAVLMSMSYKDRERKDLQAVAREVTASIREAQNYALTGKQTGSDEMPCAFQIELNSDSYQINHSVRDIDAENCEGSTFVKFFASGAVKLPLKVKMDVAAYSVDRTGGWDTDVNTITFDVPYGKVDILSLDHQPNTGVEIVLSKNDKYAHLCVHTTGLIEDMGINNSSAYICGSNF